MKKFFCLLIGVVLFSSLVSKNICDNTFLKREREDWQKKELVYSANYLDISNKLIEAYQVVIMQHNIITQQATVIEMQYEIIEANKHRRLNQSFAIFP